MYDTLLQMGRWFGYRDGYIDLCSLYMTVEATAWYGHISAVIDELRNELRLMERLGRQPVDFGLKVRAHPTSLIVTARNKMRRGRKVVHSVSLDGRLVETAYLRSDPLVLAENFQHLVDLVEELDHSYGSRREQLKGLGTLWRGVSVDLVLTFIERFRNHD